MLFGRDQIGYRDIDYTRETWNLGYAGDSWRKLSAWDNNLVK